MMFIKPEEISVELIQQEYGTPQRSTDGEEQLKYSFLDQSRNPPLVRPQHENSC